MAIAEPTTVDALRISFAQVLGSMLLPDEYQAPSLARIAGQSPAPDTDAEVRAEAIRSAHMIAEIERNAEALQARITALQAKKAHALELAEMLRHDVRDLMITAGVKSARDLDLEIYIRRNPDKLAVSVSAEELQTRRPEFVRTKLEIDKAGINAHYKKTGELIDGVDVVEGGHTVTIKA